MPRGDCKAAASGILQQVSHGVREGTDAGSIPARLNKGHDCIQLTAQLLREAACTDSKPELINSTSGGCLG